MVVAEGGVYGTFVDLDGAVRTEAELVNKYRQIAMHPEVEMAKGIAAEIYDWLRGTPGASGPGFSLAGVHVTNLLSNDNDRRWAQSVQFTCGFAPA
jgi:hypothetical protein